MYVWMILATFIVMLMAFNLSPRTDMQQQQDTPLAEAAITKFLVQHDAAVKYVRSVLGKYHNNPSANTGLALKKHTITGCQNSSDSLCSFLPIGFQYEENLYNSTYYCLNAAEYKSVTGQNGQTSMQITKYEGSQEGTSCNETTTIDASGNKKTNSIYVITYGRVPERWKNVSSNKILASYYNAMHRLVAVGSSCGIVRPKLSGTDKRNTMNSNYIIEGIDVHNNSIPPYFLQNDNTFKEKCLSNYSNFPCIIYVTNL